MLPTLLILLGASPPPATDGGTRPTIEIRMDQARAPCGFRHVEISGTEDGAELVGVVVARSCAGGGAPQTIFVRKALDSATTRELVRDLGHAGCIEAKASTYVSIQIGQRRCVGFKQLGNGVNVIWGHLELAVREAAPMAKTSISRPREGSGPVPAPRVAILEGGTRCEAASAEENVRHGYPRDALACSDGTVVEELFQGETWVAERYWPADKRKDYVPVERVEL